MRVQHHGGLASAVASAVLAGLAGCGGGAKGGCPALDSCGGNPAGLWSISDVCQYQPLRPAQPVDTVDFTNATGPLAPTLAPPQPNPVVVQQTTSGDWCSGLVIRPNGTVENAMLFHDAPRVIDGQFLFVDGSYVTRLIFSTPDEPPSERNSTHFAPRCLQANGGNPTCDAVQKGLEAFYVPIKPTVPSSFQKITCTQSAVDGGCDCSYVYVVQVDDGGKYLVQPDGSLLQDSTVLTFNGATAYPQAASRPFQTTMCAAGGVLQLSGPNGGALSGLQGLRTLVLVPKPQM